jgi:hypothetical protein
MLHDGKNFAIISDRAQTSVVKQHDLGFIANLALGNPLLLARKAAQGTMRLSARPTRAQARHGRSSASFLDMPPL